MKNKFNFLFVTLIFLFGAPSLYALNGQETFLQANKLYQEKRFADALAHYSKIDKKGAATWYNMGNCHYQLSHETDALLCWKRAQKDASISLSRDIEFNIDAVRDQQRKSDEKTVFNELILILRHIPILLIQILFLIVWIALFVVIRLSKHSKKYKVASFVLISFMIPLAALAAVKYKDNQTQLAIAFQDAHLFAGPNEKYHVICPVAAKEFLRIYSKQGDWYKVEHSNQMGWVSSSDIVVV